MRNAPQSHVASKRQNANKRGGLCLLRKIATLHMAPGRVDRSQLLFTVCTCMNKGHDGSKELVQEQDPRGISSAVGSISGRHTSKFRCLQLMMCWTGGGPCLAWIPVDPLPCCPADQCQQRTPSKVCSKGRMSDRASGPVGQWAGPLLPEEQGLRLHSTSNDDIPLHRCQSRPGRHHRLI